MKRFAGILFLVLAWSAFQSVHAQKPACTYSQNIVVHDCRRQSSIPSGGVTTVVTNGAWWALALAFGGNGYTPTFVHACAGGFDQTVTHHAVPECAPVTFVSECRLDSSVEASVGGNPGDNAEVVVAAAADGLVLPPVAIAIGARAAGVAQPPASYSFSINGVTPSVSVYFPGTSVPPPTSDSNATSAFVVGTLVTEFERLGGSAEARARAMAGAWSKVSAECTHSQVRTEVSSGCPVHGTQIVSRHEARMP